MKTVEHLGHLDFFPYFELGPLMFDLHLGHLYFVIEDSFLLLATLSFKIGGAGECSSITIS
jgi:hypothetical protein